MTNKTSERKINLLGPACFLVGGSSNGLHLPFASVLVDFELSLFYDELAGRLSFSKLSK